MKPAQCYKTVGASINDGFYALAALLLHALTVCILSLVLPHICQAFEYPQKISFLDIMKDEDIALGEVQGIVQDSEGFIWLGGRNDLLRFDGQAFLSVPALNPQNPGQYTPIRHVLEIFEDHQNTLWVASHSGLFRYQREQEQFVAIALPQEQSPRFFRRSYSRYYRRPFGQPMAGHQQWHYFI